MMTGCSIPKFLPGLIPFGGPTPLIGLWMPWMPKHKDLLQDFGPLVQKPWMLLSVPGQERTCSWWWPPIHLVPRVFRHTQYAKVNGTLIIPQWLSSPFWPLLFPDGLCWQSVKGVIELPISDALILPGQPDANLFNGLPNMPLLVLRLVLMSAATTLCYLLFVLCHEIQSTVLVYTNCISLQCCSRCTSAVLCNRLDQPIVMFNIYQCHFMCNSLYWPTVLINVYQYHCIRCWLQPTVLVYT